MGTSSIFMLTRILLSSLYYKKYRTIFENERKTKEACITDAEMRNIYLVSFYGSDVHFKSTN